MNINGTNGNDALRGTAGNDIINGLAGVDFVTYDTSYGDVRTFFTPNRFVVSAVDRGEGHDVLHNIEWVHFGDGVRLQLTEDAQQTLMTVATDTDDVQDWSVIRTKLDDDGKALSRFTEYDNGTARAELNEYDTNGSLATRTVIDGPGAFSGTRSWDRWTATYDEDGRVESRVTTYDKGSTVTQNFEYDASSRLAVRVDLDGRFDASGSLIEGTDNGTWASRELTFGDNRRLDSVVTEFDDGTFNTEVREYDAVTGRQSGRTTYDGRIVDGANGPTVEGGRNPWESIAVAFDDVGRAQSLVTTYDSGRQMTRSFVRDDTGALLARVDRDGVYNEDTQQYDNEGLLWDLYVIQYDGGGRISNSMLYFDNSDTTETTFEGNRVVERVFSDNSDSEDWTTRTDTFDANGDVTTSYVWDDGMGMSG